LRVRVRQTLTFIRPLRVAVWNEGQLDLAAWVSDSRRIAIAFTFYDRDPSTGSPSPLGSVTATKGAVDQGQSLVINLPAGLNTYYAVASNTTGCQLTGIDQVNIGSGASLDSIGNLTVNSGDLVQVGFSSPDASYILWLNHHSFNNPYIGLLGSAGLGDLVFTAQNHGSTPKTAMIRVIAYNGNCAGQLRDFYITVNPSVKNRQAANYLQLTAQKINVHDVRINWQINYEFALTQIEVEKLKGESEWVKISTSALLTDAFIDRSGMSNVTKYRLKLIHADGRAIWSQEVEVSFDFYHTERFTLYPNPTQGRFGLRVAGGLEGDWSYKLSDQMGRILLTGKLQDNETAFDISHMPAGHYHLVISSPTGKRYLRKIAKR